MRDRMSDYVIERDQSDWRKVKPWIVRKDGELIRSHARDRHPKLFRTRIEAQVAIEAGRVLDAYLTRLYEQDVTGKYEWTPNELGEIAKFADALRANEEKWTFNGPRPFQEIARDGQVKDAEDIAKGPQAWCDSKRLFAERRRRMAARVEAFRQAGVEL